MNKLFQAAGLTLCVAAFFSGCALIKTLAVKDEHKAITTEKLEPYECGTITCLHTYGGVFLAS